MSGLAAGITAVEELQSSGVQEATPKIVLLEKSETLGGRVKSDTTDDGYVLDQGFAVFIEEYPFSKKLLDYDALKLGRFVPGSLVKLRDYGESGVDNDSPYGPLFKVADPLRVPSDLITAVLAPVGTFMDKVRVLFLLFNVFTNSVEELFEQEEVDTLTCLRDTYGFSEKFIEEFFTPFLEGIYLAPLKEQSSRMFHFVFKMFSEGSATLPEGGMGKVANLLESNAKASNIDIRTSSGLSSINLTTGDDHCYTIETSDNKRIKAKSVIIATDGQATQNILSSFPDFHFLKSEPEQVQRTVGCIYYGFSSPLPIAEPILILNGAERSPQLDYPVNNVCFPSAVNKGYAPNGCNLCSVTILEPTLKAYEGREDELDLNVREHLKTWFPKYASDIETKWEMKGMYKIPNAQPGQLKGPLPANVNGGRDCSAYRGKNLPKGLFLCGDHMATATLNGALESGINAGKEAAKSL